MQLNFFLFFLSFDQHLTVVARSSNSISLFEKYTTRSIIYLPINYHVIYLYRQFLTSHHRLLNRSPRKRHRSSLDIIPPLPQEEGNLSSYYLGSLMNTRSRSHERVQYPGETSNTLKTVFVIRKLFEGETQDGGGGGPGWDQARTNEARFGAETKGRRTNGERRRVIACIHVSKWPGVC